MGTRVLRSFFEGRRFIESAQKAGTHPFTDTDPLRVPYVNIHIVF